MFFCVCIVLDGTLVHCMCTSQHLSGRDRCIHLGGERRYDSRVYYPKTQCSASQTSPNLVAVSVASLALVKHEPLTDSMCTLSGGRHQEKQRRFQQPAPGRCLRTRPVYGRRQMGHTDWHDSRIKTKRTDSWYASHVHPRHSSRQTRNQERVRVSSV